MLIHTQDQFESYVEAVIETAAILGAAYLSLTYIFPLIGLHLCLSSKIWITTWFAFLFCGILYFIRRVSNKIAEIIIRGRW